MFESVAQLVEHLPLKQTVVGSNPTRLIGISIYNNGQVAELVKAADCKSVFLRRPWGFESLPVHRFP
jgi:hypothetical protein